MEDKPLQTQTPSRPPYNPLFDLNSWKSKEYWSISEAVKLICGRNPYEKTPGQQIFNRGKRVIDIIDQAFAAAQRGQMKLVRNGMLAVHSLVEPASFIRWAIRAELEVPEPFVKLADMDIEKNPQLKEALLKERVQTVAATLWIVHPTLSANEIATHQAMIKLVGDNDISSSKKLDWILEAPRPT